MEPLDPCPEPFGACDGTPSGGVAHEVLLERAIERGDFRGASRRGFLIAAGFALPALAFLGERRGEVVSEDDDIVAVSTE